MSFLAEWQKQQKALKDAERDRKKNASSFLNKYRGGEHDIKDQKQQKILKDAERESKMNASSLLHSYRGGEHDIKDQKQQKILKDAERESKMNASSLLHSYRGSEHDIKDQKQQKILKDAERESKMNASSLLHSYRGSEHDIRDQKQQKILKDAERESKMNASSLLHSYRGGEHDIKDYERVIIEERKENHAREKTEHHVSDVVEDAVAETKSGIGGSVIDSNDVSKSAEDHAISNVSAESKSDSGDGHSENYQAREKAEQHVSNGSAETKSSAGDNHPGKSRKTLNIDFSFGIIHPDDEPEPGADLCASAASVIIPHVISQWTNETKIFCNPKTPEVIGEIITDDWYDGDDSIRYKVKGKVAVHVFAESSANEVAEGLTKVLRRHVSFRAVSASEVDKASKEKKTQFIIGDGAQKWMRVREGRLGGLGITF